SRISRDVEPVFALVVQLSRKCFDWSVIEPVQDSYRYACWSPGYAERIRVSSGDDFTRSHGKHIHVGITILSEGQRIRSEDSRGVHEPAIVQLERNQPFHRSALEGDGVAQAGVKNREIGHVIGHFHQLTGNVLRRNWFLSIVDIDDGPRRKN